MSIAEREFLKAHPVIRLGVGEEWDPLVIRRTSGGLDGFDADLLRHVNAVTGANLQLVAGPWLEIVEQAKAREIDGLTSSAANAERAESFLFSDTYLTVYPVFVIAADSQRQIRRIDDLNGQTVAILAGHKFYAAMLAAYPEITVAERSSETDAIRMVLEGDAAAAVVATTHFEKHHKAFSGLIRIGHVATEKPLSVRYSVRKDWPELVSILNRALNALPVDEYNRIYQRWFNLEPSMADSGSRELRFTAAEQTWLAQKHVVRARVGEYMPYYTAVDGVRGLAIDYLSAVADRAGFKVEYVTEGTWTQALADIREHRNVDLLPSANITPERQEFLVFTDTYLKSPSVILTREDSPFVSSMADLAKNTVVVERDYAVSKWLDKEYPGVKKLIRETTGDALTALAAGEADAYVGNLTVSTYTLKTLGLSNVKVAAPSPLGTDLQAMAVRNDWPELATIIDKTLATFSPEEHAAIYNRWLPPINYQQGFSAADVLKWIAVVTVLLLAVIIAILTWNKKLASEIEARIAAEALLAQSEEKYRTLFERSADAFLIIAGDCFVDCNEATVRMLGYASKEEFLNIPPWKLSPARQPDGKTSKEKATEMIAFAMAHGSHRFEWDHIRANGEAFPVEVLLTAIDVGPKQVLHVVWRDITERRKAEEALQRVTEDLSQKNIELERFCYTVSHDLKSPLITIQGFAGMLEMSLGDRIDDDIREFLSYINAAATKMYALLDDLLALSRIGRVINPAESVDLAEVSREAITLIEGLLINKSMTIEVVSDLPRVIGDRMRLREVWQNLLENAVKYMGDQPEPRIEIGVAEIDGRPACYVRDNGIGIAERYHEKIFGLFERLSNEGEGTGVGLAQVKRIIELHGGRIWVESAGPGQGSTFWFTLPREESAATG